MPTPFWAQPRFVLLIIFAYLAIHFGVRLAMWSTLGIDDAEQALFAQHLAWSTRFRAPPLFTWLLVALGKAIGVDILAISLIRYALLGVTFAFIYLTARRLVADPRLSALSLYSFAAIYVFAYYSHHDLTHTTALSALLAVSWYVFLRLRETPTLGWYLALGAAFGLGVLAKWNFVMFAAALFAACLASPDHRRLALSWKAAAAAGVAGFLVTPTVLAALRLGPAAGDSVRATLGGGAGPAAIGDGIANLALASIAYPQPLLPMLVAVLGAPLWRGIQAAWSGAERRGDEPDIGILGWTMVVAIALHALLVLAIGATEISERLMQPALLVLPIFLFGLIERGRPSRRAVNAFAILLALLAAGTLAARIVVYLRSADDCRSCRAMAPFADLARQLTGAGFAGRGTIVADGFHVGGNMRVVFPAARIVEPGFPPATWPAATGAAQCLLVWRVRDPAAPAKLPEKLRAYLAGPLGGDEAAPHVDGTAAAPMFASRQLYRLDYRLYDGPVGECR